MAEDKEEQNKSKNYQKAIIISLLGTAITTLLFVVTSAGLVSPPEDQEFDINLQAEDNLTGTLDVGIDDGIMHADYSTDEVDLIMTEEEGSQVIKYQRDFGKLEIKESYNSSIETIEAPQGEMKTGYKDGRQIKEFQGQNQTEIENKKQELKEDLDKLLRSIENQKESLEKERLPEIVLEVNKEDEDDTYFELTNQDDEKINLENWVMEGLESETSTRDAEHTFEPLTLEPEETLKVYTESDNQIDEEEKHTIAEEMTIYSSTSDTIVLFNDLATEITRKSYNQ